MIDRQAARIQAVENLATAANDLTRHLMMQIEDSRPDVAKQVYSRCELGARLQMTIDLATHECELILCDAAMGNVPLVRSVIPEAETEMTMQ